VTHQFSFGSWLRLTTSAPVSHLCLFGRCSRRWFDRIASSALVEALIGLDDGLWNEWHDPDDYRKPFDFLGYPFGRMHSARTGKAYLG
jgi:hypothetical protein